MAEDEKQPATADCTSTADVASTADAEEMDAKKRRSKNPRWLPLESNPDIMNGFLSHVGVQSGAEFMDVLVLDDDLPQPVFAVCLLFPSKPIRKPRLEALAAQGEQAAAPDSTFYLIQHSDFGNACGTIAAVHAIGNLARSGKLKLQTGSPIESFLQHVAGKSPADIGWELADASDLHEASEQAAKSREAQTKTPGRHDKVDGHFVVFVEVEGMLVELDGCMGSPLLHGPTSETTLLRDAAKVIQVEFMARAPGNLNFSVMALASNEAPGQGAASSATDYSAQVEMIVAMGRASPPSSGATPALWRTTRAAGITRRSRSSPRRTSSQCAALRT